MPYRRKKLSWSLLALLLTVFALTFLYVSERTFDHQQQLKYSVHFGFYNPSHFDPNLKDKYQEFSKLQGKDSLDFTLHRQMQAKTFWAYVQQNRTYHFKVAPNLSTQNMPKAFFEMCRQISQDFEQQQAEFPHNMLKSSRNSSFRVGDVTGDYLSYLYATNAIDTHTINEHFKSIEGYISDVQQYNQIQEELTKNPFQDWQQTKAIFDGFDFDILPYSIDRYTPEKPLCHLQNTEDHWSLAPLNYKEEYPLLYHPGFMGTFLMVFGIPIVASIIVSIFRKPSRNIDS